MNQLFYNGHKHIKKFISHFSCEFETTKLQNLWLLLIFNSLFLINSCGDRDSNGNHICLFFKFVMPMTE